MDCIRKKIMFYNRSAEAELIVKVIKMMDRDYEKVTIEENGFGILYLRLRKIFKSIKKFQHIDIVESEILN